MQAKVCSDSTRRVIRISLADVPVMDVTRAWSHQSRKIRPDRLTITMVDGAVTYVEIDGPRVLANGQDSENSRDDMSWSCNGAEENWNGAPGWVQALAREAPLGVVFWGQAESTEAPA